MENSSRIYQRETIWGDLSNEVTGNTYSSGQCVAENSLGIYQRETIWGDVHFE